MQVTNVYSDTCQTRWCEKLFSARVWTVWPWQPSACCVSRQNNLTQFCQRINCWLQTCQDCSVQCQCAEWYISLFQWYVCRLVITEFQRDSPTFVTLGNIASDSVSGEHGLSIQNDIKTSSGAVAVDSVDHQVMTGKSCRIRPYYLTCACLFMRISLRQGISCTCQVLRSVCDPWSYSCCLSINYVGVCVCMYVCVCVCV